MLKLVNVVSNKAHAGIAQLVEQRTENPRVTSSSLVPGIQSNYQINTQLPQFFQMLQKHHQG